MTIGITSQTDLPCRGFTYVEVLISFLILSSGILAYVMLIARTELIQIQANQSLKAVFMADYMVTHVALSVDNCKSNYDCLAQKIKLGIFDATSPLLEGYGWSALSGANTESSLGCIEYDNTSNVFTISIFYDGQSLSDSKVTDCANKLRNFQYAVRYAPLSLSMEIME